MTTIYAIGPAGGPYKIGFAISPRKRLAQLQTGQHLPLSIWLQAQTDTPREHESGVHSELKDYRQNGEWFLCAIDEVQAAMSRVGLSPERHRIEPRTQLPAEHCMSADTFGAWLGEMRKRPFFADDAACGRLLGVSANTVLEMKQRGADTRTALACRALLHRLEPYA